MADIPAQMADLDARRWADLLSQIPHSPTQNPGEYGDSGPSSSTQRDFLTQDAAAYTIIIIIIIVIILIT